MAIGGPLVPVLTGTLETYCLFVCFPFFVRPVGICRDIDVFLIAFYALMPFEPGQT